MILGQLPITNGEINKAKTIISATTYDQEKLVILLDQFNSSLSMSYSYSVGELIKIFKLTPTSNDDNTYLFDGVVVKCALEDILRGDGKSFI